LELTAVGYLAMIESSAAQNPYTHSSRVNLWRLGSWPFLKRPRFTRFVFVIDDWPFVERRCWRDGKQAGKITGNWSPRPHAALIGESNRTRLRLIASMELAASASLTGNTGRLLEHVAGTLFDRFWPRS
jgi:hypothetical protein